MTVWMTYYGYERVNRYEVIEEYEVKKVPVNTR